MLAICEGLIAFLCCAGIVAIFLAFSPRSIFSAVIAPQYAAEYLRARTGEKDGRGANQN